MKHRFCSVLSSMETLLSGTATGSKETPFSEPPMRMDTAKCILGLFKHVSLKNFKIKHDELFILAMFRLYSSMFVCYTQTQDTSSRQNMQVTSATSAK